MRNIKRFSIFLFILHLAVTGNAQEFKWAFNLGGTKVDQAKSVTADSDGNIYVTGRFKDICDFDPGPGGAALSSPNSAYDLYIAKYDSSGNYVWALSVGDIGHEVGFGIALDNSNNVFVTGEASGTMDFDPGVGTAMVTIPGGEGMFVAKYDVDGNYVWAFGFGGGAGEIAKNVATDELGNVFVCGEFRNTVDFDPGPDTASITSLGSRDGFLAKYDANGNFLWAHTIASTTSVSGHDVATDPSGNVFITGYYSTQVDFDPGPDSAILSSTSNTYEIYIAKYDPNGDYLWAMDITGPGNNQGIAIVTDEAGNVITTGIFGDSPDFDPGAGTATIVGLGALDTYMAKYDANGNYVWAKGILGGDNIVSRDITLGATGNVYIAGTFGLGTDFDPGPGTANLTLNNPSRDMYFAKYDSDGNYVWAKGFAGLLTNHTRGITFDGHGNIVVVGEYASLTDFNPDAGVVNLAPQSEDAFILKYAAEPIFVGTDESMEASKTLSIYPNPFSNTTTIAFSTPGASAAHLGVFDLSGCLVTTLYTGSTVKGHTHELIFDASNLSSGIYFLRLVTERVSLNKKLVVVN